MDSLVEWFANNGSALWATIISFFSVYGVALISLVIGIIRTKLTAIAQEKASDEKVQELTANYIEKLNKMEQEIIEAANVNTEKRIAAMQDIADSVNAANDELKEAATVETSDASNALNSLE